MNIKFVISVICCVLFTACNSNDKNLLEIQKTKRENLGCSLSQQSIITPGLVDYWENQTTARLSSGNNVNLPWVEGASVSGSYMNFFNDVKKEDGWILLFHTLDSSEFNSNKDYIFLYNQLTGFLKVFFFYDPNGMTSSGLSWLLSSSSNQKTAFFNLNNYVALPNNSNNEMSSVALSNANFDPSYSFQPGWNGFEIEIPYCNDYKNMEFNLSVYNNGISRACFSGITEKTVPGIIVKVSDEEGVISQAVATIGGVGSKEIITQLKNKVDGYQTSDIVGEIKAKLGPKIINALLDVKKDDFTKAVTTGLNLIFGSSTVVNTKTNTSQFYLSSVGAISLKGKPIKEQKSPISPMSNFNFYKLMNSTPQSIKAYKSLGITLPSRRKEGEAFLGLWSLASDPLIYIERYSKIESSLSLYGCLQEGVLYGPHILKHSCDLLINPQIEKYLTKYDYTIKLVSCRKMNNKKNLDNSFIPSGFYTDLIYEDDNMSLYESPIDNLSKNPTCILGSKTPAAYDYYWDWNTKDIRNEVESNIMAVVSVTFYYQINGKEIKVNSSRAYKAKLFFDTDKRILKSGRNRRAYIVNTNTFCE